MKAINEYALEMFAAELRTRIAGREYAIATIRSRNHDPHADEMSIAVNQAHLDELENVRPDNSPWSATRIVHNQAQEMTGSSPWKSPWDSHIALRFDERDLQPQYMTLNMDGCHTRFFLTR